MPETSAIDQQTRETLVAPFITATQVALREMANSDVEARGACYRQSADGGAIRAVLPLTSATLEALVLSVPAETAAHLARRILAETGESVDDALVRDCLGETINVIAGQAKALLHGTPYQFTFATPQVLLGEVGGADRPRLVIEFTGSVGELALEVQTRP